ncbi:MAG TPA: hypothetical protein VHQ22_18070 [Terriglobales bacterium]|jgi:hypothetical protein|nr:hypothetical protein [Terriglobales bacterium]
MAPFLCPSPNIVDHSFPRSVDELHLVRSALVRILRGIQNGEFIFLLTPPLRTFIHDANNFDWTRIGEYPELQVIYHIIAQLGLQPAGVLSIDVSEETPYIPHPVPEGCAEQGVAPQWADETGRLFTRHERMRRLDEGPFIGVACTCAFAGEALGTYVNPDNVPHFPLIGPAEVLSLSDGEEWQVPEGIIRQSISFENAKNRIRLLGGTVTKPKGSSHYQVKFKGARTWPLDYNYRDVPEKYLRELEPITGVRLSVIKFVLLNGKWPEKKNRLL